MNGFSKLLRSSSRQALPIAPKSWDDVVAESKSRDGFERERAVFELARRGRPEALPVFLERLNDWVPQVRSAAREAIASFLSTPYLYAWVVSVDQVIALGRGKRASHDELLLRIKDLLATAETVATLRAVHKLSTPEFKKFIFDLELAIPLTNEERYEAFVTAVSGKDMAVAVAAMKSIQLLTIEHQCALALVACESIFGDVRLRGLREVLQLNPPSARRLVRTLCVDVNAGVRSVACANAAGDVEQVVADLKIHFAGPSGSKIRAAALDALCIFKAPEARILCSAALHDSASVVRCIAFAWAFNFASGNERDHLVVPALQDAATSVRRVAIKNVMRGAAAPDVDQLLQLLSENQQALGAFISVATRLSPWARLTFLLKTWATRQDDVKTANDLCQALMVWDVDMAHCYVQPGLGESKALLTIWPGLQNRLPVSLRTRLAYQLTAFGIPVA